MFAPIKRPPARRRIVTYDLEWIPGTLEVRCAGVYDGNEYRCYTSVSDFLSGELVPANSGKWYYAHAGGLYDCLFLLHDLIQRGGFQVEGCFSGSSAVILTLKKWGCRWEFLDSLFTLRAKLEDIAVTVGEKKGGGEARKASESWYATVPFAELKDYNESDCRILHKALLRFEDEIWNLGGELERTLASTAMSLFRRQYLKRTLRTAEADCQLAQGAYTASRVEIFRRRCRQAGHWDINSAFPAGMCIELPGSLLGPVRGIPRVGPFLAHVSVKVPEESFIPPLPYRIAHRVFFPTGTWDTWITRPDLEALEMGGGQVLSCDECYCYEPFTDFRDYVAIMYEGKKNAKDPFTRNTFKSLLNSLYGKTNESPTKDQLRIYPPKLECKRRIPACPRPCDPRCDWSPRRLMPGVYLVPIERTIAHRHSIIAATVTAEARRILYGYLLQVPQPESNLFYSDTDSVFARADLPCSPELGKLKYEGSIERDGRFHQPKFYRADDAVFCKGFPDGLTVKQFESMCDAADAGSEPVVIEKRHMARVRELYGAGLSAPREEVRGKALRPGYLPKRCQHSDDSTRPYSVPEIQSLLNAR